MALAQLLQRNSHMQSVALGYAAMGDATGAALAQAAVKMQQQRQQPRIFKGSKDEGTVVLTTVHKATGLEWHTVLYRHLMLEVI